MINCETAGEKILCHIDGSAADLMGEFALVCQALRNELVVQTGCPAGKISACLQALFLVATKEDETHE